MGRKKIIQAWIADDVVRRNTLRNRRNGILKKIKEFTTLCDVEACAVVYGPNDPEPEVWPNVPEARCYNLYVTVKNCTIIHDFSFDAFLEITK